MLFRRRDFKEQYHGTQIWYHNTQILLLFQSFVYADGYGKDRNHTPFTRLDQLVYATHQFMNNKTTFLHFGVREIREKWGMDRYHGKAMKMLWPFFAPFRGKNPPEKITFKPSAHMAVRREAIQSIPREVYYGILQQVRYTNSIKDHQTARQVCCAMERMWHILFGQPYVLPKSAIVSDLLNLTNCTWCNGKFW
jgi:Protein of unknown function (DUF3431)